MESSGRSQGSDEPGDLNPRETGRILALDLGEGRVGVAVSDPTGTIAQPLSSVPASPWRHLLDSLRELVQAYQPRAILVGLAVRENGSLGPEAQSQRERARALEEALGIRVHLHDERYTTRMARRVQRELGHRGPSARGKLHSLAAAHLLSDFLSYEETSSFDPTTG